MLWSTYNLLVIFNYKREEEEDMKREVGFLTFLLLIALIFFLVADNFLQFPSYTVPIIKDKLYIFYDDFSAPIIHFNWVWCSDFGEGSVKLFREGNRTFIEFHVYGTEYTRANFLREFVPSSSARVEVVLQFVGLHNDSIGLIMFRTNGGWFGVTRPEPHFTPYFVYVDDLGRTPPNILIKPVDEKLHKVVIEHKDGVRKLYFDEEFIESLQGPPQFTYLIIGTRDYVKGYAGIFRIDYVRVELLQESVG